MSADLRRRLLLLAAALFTAWAVWQVREVEGVAPRSALSQRAPLAASTTALAEPNSPMSLPERVRHTEPVRDLFQMPHPPAPPPAPVVAPQAPPLPFAYLGGISDASDSQVFLGEGTRTLAARQGTRLAGGWLLEAVEPGRLVFNYEALQQRQILARGDRR